MRRYFARKLATYLLTFVVAVTIDWAIPRFMPGDPVQGMVARIQVNNVQTANALDVFYRKSFGLDLPIWQQYLNFWKAILHGDLGLSVLYFPEPVTHVIFNALPYTVGLLVPAILLSYWAGNKTGALAARRKVLDNTVLPVGYLLTATPYMWLGIMLAWTMASRWRWFPISGGYSYSLQPSWTPSFVENLARHWFLPFLSLFLVGFGGWAIGMRNLIIYELESDYSNYLASLGAPTRLVRRYAYRNAVLPQLTGLALQLGVIVAGALVTEVVFNYPGIGHLLLQALQNEDFFLIQGVFLFIITGVLIANFLIDVAYVLVDPRTRAGMTGVSA
jgi:peptide/nickel transport system permease protein